MKQLSSIVLAFAIVLAAAISGDAAPHGGGRPGGGSPGGRSHGAGPHGAGPPAGGPHGAIPHGSGPHGAGPRGGHGFSGHPPHGHFPRHHGFAGRHHFAPGVFGGAFIAVPFYWPPAYSYAPPPPGYWYYCPRYGAYYPAVQSCPEPWLPVPAR